jgi:hypothetical protein
MAEPVTIGGAELLPSGAASPAPNGAGGPAAGSPPATGPAPNGGAALLPVPRRTAWVPEENDDRPEARAFAEAYPGMRVRLWINYPKRLQAEISPAGVEDADERERRAREALKKIVLEHNGWADEDGAALPPPSDDGFWETIPDELAAGLVLLVLRAPSRLPNSMLAALRGSERGST